MKHPPVWTVRSVVACAAGAVALGAVVTAGSAGVALWRAGRGMSSTFLTVIAGREGGNYICTCSRDFWACSVRVQAFPPPPARAVLSAHELEAGLEFQRSILTANGDERWEPGPPGGYGFSSVPAVEELGGLPWVELTCGWPLRCVRVRGLDLSGAPVTWGRLGSLSGLGGRWVWAPAPAQAAMSVAVVAGPALVGTLVIRGWWIRRRQRVWAARGWCVRCGYEARATTCPECGWGAEGAAGCGG